MFPLHFQIDASGDASSPQIPQAKHNELADNEKIKKEDVTKKQLLLDEVSGLLTDELAKSQIAIGEQRMNQLQLMGSY